MKKILALILAVIMTVTAIPFVSSALTYSEYSTVLTPYATKGFTQSATSKMNEEILKIGAYPYYHYSAAAGSYGNSDMIFTFKPLDVALSDYPYIKIAYRTNTPAARLDVSMLTAAGEKWMNVHPSITASGEWTSMIFNYNDIIGNTSVAFPAAGDKDITVRIKPFGSGNYTLSSDAYFDISYIALFKTQAEAEAFVHNSGKMESYTYSTLTADALYSKYLGTNKTKSVFFDRYSSSESFVRTVAEAGTYNNNLVISFGHDAFSLLEYPFVKICYRTDARPSKCDVSMTSDKGENWLTAMPVMDKSGEWANMVFNVNDMTGNTAVEAPDADSVITVRLKPWGTYVDVPEESYFDIKYISFFATEEEANAYEYPGDTAYPFDFSLTNTGADYSFASNAKVLEYIDAAEARENEIKHTNNTVPYENHLTFSGLTGTYYGDYKSSSYSLTAPAGSYTSSTGIISFKQNDIDFKTFPYVKLGYRINSDFTLAAGYKNTSGTTKSLSVSNGIIDLSGTTNMSSLEIMPFGSGSRTLSNAMYFSLDYIGLFKTKAEAEAYTYKGENADNMTDTHIIYTANLLDPASTVTGSVYFVSSSTGNDSNDGLTPATAWKTIEKVTNRVKNYSLTGTVYFKRGDTFRSNVALEDNGKTTFTSYGYGDKPKLIFSIDASGSGNWIATGTENIWKYKNTITNNTQQGDIGNIRFTDHDGNLYWGIKVTRHTSDDYRVDNGNVYNGRTFIEPLADVAVNGGLGLYNDLEYHHNYNGELYLYCEEDPNTAFASIEIADKGHGITGNGSNVLIDNLYIAGAGSHGVSYGSITNTVVRNCYLEWIGGSIQTLGPKDENNNYTQLNPTRFGNAVESYGSAINFTIANCFASQVYDCCWTVQNQGAVTFQNVYMYDNVAEYSNTGLEIWQTGGVTDNLYLHDNYTMYGGYGWSHQRPLKDGNFFYGGMSVRTTTTFTNCSVENNINVLSTTYGVLAAELGSTRYNFNHNVYVMGENKAFTYAPADTEHGTTATSSLLFNNYNISNITSRGTEKGSKFYYVATNAMNIGDDPREAFSISNNPIDSISLGLSSKTIGITDTFTVNASIAPANATSTELCYSSSKPSVASVDENGVVTGLYPGMTNIVVTSVESGASASMTVFVANDNPPLFWSKNAAENDATKANVLFAGDNFLCGENSVVTSLVNKYYINETVEAADGASFGGSRPIVDLLSKPDDIFDAVILTGGYNDYSESVNINDFKSSLYDTVTGIRELSPYSNVIYVAPYMLSGAENSLGLTLSDYVAAAKEICEENKVTFADMSEKAASLFTLISKDGNVGEINANYIDSNIHTTTKGADIFADELIRILSDEQLITVYGIDAFDNRYSAYKIYKNLNIIDSVRFTKGGIIDEGMKSYARVDVTDTITSENNIAGDGTSFDVKFTSSNIKIKDYPFIKIYYRASVADSSASLDLNAGVICSGANTRLWTTSGAGGYLSYDKTGELASMTIDASKFFASGEGGKSFADIDSGSAIKYLRFKPYHSQRTLNVNDYFEIESISFYATAEEAARDGKPIDDAAVICKGDANADGTVNMIDAIMIARHLAEWDGYKNNILFTVSDIDSDGYITPGDPVALLRHLADWDGYETILDN